MENRTMEKEMQQANSFLDFYYMKAAQIENQWNMYSDQVEKLAVDRWQSSAALENTQKWLLDVRGESQQVRESLEESQGKVERSRFGLAELHIELEKERFNKKRIEEELETVRRKATRLRARTEGSSLLEKLQQELRDYKEILKCSICHDKPKEVKFQFQYLVFYGLLCGA
ncbi:hypothetical protein HHK36_000935 [Tetracentron sinense]|uniref:E3 ubiquitin protein ligase n=1 Tax=Tetracentron sinense TaxID=13715 RepID=A0A835DQH0_TETSI|nr:hypothetical protein HHK36_000935 [Tetracentron sinense]